MDTEHINDNEPSATADTRRSSIRHFSLMNSLLTILNTTKHDSTENILARYFLDHFEHLELLNIYDVAEECFTSRSGIRRFCQSIGLDNFSDLKSYTWEWNKHHDQYIDYATQSNYRLYLTAALDDMTDQINATADDVALDMLVELIQNSERIVVLTSGFSSMAVSQFQQGMLYLHKVIDVITDSTGDTAQLSALDAHDLLFVISEHGNYAKAIISSLSNSNTKRVLITVDASPELDDEYLYTIRLANKPQPSGRTVFANYGVTYFLDLLYNRYLELS